MKSIEVILLAFIIVLMNVIKRLVAINKRVGLGVAVLLVWLTSAPLYAQDDTIILGANESPPFWSIKLPYDGMCGEIVHAISAEADLISYIRFMPLKRLIEDDSNNDLGNPQFYMTNQDFAAIVPIAIYNAAIFYFKPEHTEKITFKSMQDLKGYRIGILKGTLIDHSIFKKAGIAFEESYTQESLFKKLRLGRVDLVIEIDLLGRTMINELFPDDAGNFESIVIQGSAAPIAILMAEEYPDGKAIGDKYREALQRIIEGGKYNKILEKYYGKDGVPSDWFDNLKRFDRIYNFQGVE